MAAAAPPQTVTLKSHNTAKGPGRTKPGPFGLGALPHYPLGGAVVTLDKIEALPGARYPGRVRSAVSVDLTASIFAMITGLPT